MGRGLKKVYWYWILDPELRYFNEYFSTNWTEGENIYREQDFESWESAVLRAKGIEHLEPESSGNDKSEGGGGGILESSPGGEGPSNGRDKDDAGNAECSGDGGVRVDEGGETHEEGRPPEPNIGQAK